MALPIDTLLLRVAAIQIEAMASISVTAGAVGYFYYTQEDFPYFTNRLGPMESGYDSEDFDRDTYTVIMRLIVGHLTQNYEGRNEALLSLWIPTIKTYFNSREWLQTSSGSYIAELNSLIRARVTSCTGYRIFLNSGLPATQVGCEFTLTCEFDETIDLAYG